jgi:LytS/YehU family sensor histidine kinase
MENSKYDLVPLQSEIDILKIYIQLEHFRFSDKFDFDFIIDDSVETEEIEIPPMLIQPYIENAVWHGLRYRTSKGMLTVELKAKDSFVEFTITDNGIGRKKSQELKTTNQKETKSTGMKNIESRLNIINEVNKMALKVDVNDFDTTDETGTIVKIQIPINPF